MENSLVSCLPATYVSLNGNSRLKFSDAVLITDEGNSWIKKIHNFLTLSGT